MKIYLATADVDDIRWASGIGLIDGVVTTPALLADAGARDRDERELLADICRATGGLVFSTVHAVDERDIYQDGRELARVSDQMVVQVPLMEDSVGAIRRLQADGVRIATTLIFNAAQALLAAKAGASSVVTPLDHLDAAGHDAVEVVAQMRAVLSAGGAEADVVALRPASPARFAACAIAGADAVAVTTAVLRSLLVHPLTDRGVDQLLSDLSRQRTWVAP